MYNNRKLRDFPILGLSSICLVLGFIQEPSASPKSNFTFNEIGHIKEPISQHHFPTNVLTNDLYSAINNSLIFTIVEEEEECVIMAKQHFNTDENMGNGKLLGRISLQNGIDANNFCNWTILSGNLNNAFTLNPNTGYISINDSTVVDFEKINNYILEVSVSDEAHKKTIEFINIMVLNLNDNAPVISDDQEFIVTRKNRNQGTLVGTAHAFDRDGATAFHKWSIVKGNNGSAFSIDPSSGSITIHNAEAISDKKNHTFILHLSVSDGVATSAVQAIKILVE